MSERPGVSEAEFTIVYDDTGAIEGVRPAPGFACAVRHDDGIGLFDTGGDGELLLGNLTAMGFEPRDFDWILISHDDWDHNGGLGHLLAKSNRARVYLLPKFSDETKATVTDRRATLIELQGAAAIAPGVYSTGPVKGKTVEQSLVLDTPHGLLVVTGCAHPGIAKIVRQAKDTWPGPVDLVLGGFHLGQETPEAVAQIVADLRAMDVRRVGPTHCSGGTAQRVFHEAFGEAYVECGVGRVITAGP